MLSDIDFFQLIKNGPLISIDFLIQDFDGRYLLGLRKNAPAKDFYFVPGGRVFKNEKLAAAVARISKTELGYTLNFSEMNLLGVYEQFYEENFYNEPGVGTHYITMPFKVNKALKYDFCLDSQHDSYRFFSVSEILSDSKVNNYCKLYFDDLNRM